MPSSSVVMTRGVGRFTVPLKHMCSRKCESPASRGSSLNDPVPTVTMTVTVGFPSMGIVRTRTPLSRVVLLKFISVKSI